MIRVVLAWGLLVLAGCAQLPATRVVTQAAALGAQRPVEFFRLDGRLSVRSQERNFAGNIRWQRLSREEETLLFAAPLGQGVAEVSRRPDGLRLTVGADKVYQAETAEALLERAVGLRLPVEGLVYWLSALPRPGLAFEAEQDGDGRLRSLGQDGWKIEYDRYRELDGRWLPGRIFARRSDALEFRLIVDHWEAAP